MSMPQSVCSSTVTRSSVARSVSSLSEMPTSRKRARCPCAEYARPASAAKKCWRPDTTSLVRNQVGVGEPQASLTTAAPVGRCGSSSDAKPSEGGHASDTSPPHPLDGSSEAAMRYDAVVVGGGHNGLVCAAYLGRAGLRTPVLERRHIVRGARVTDEVFRGYRFTTTSMVCSLVRPRRPSRRRGDRAPGRNAARRIIRDQCRFWLSRLDWGQDCPMADLPPAGSDHHPNQAPRVRASPRARWRWARFFLGRFPPGWRRVPYHPAPARTLGRVAS